MFIINTVVLVGVLTTRVEQKMQERKIERRKQFSFFFLIIKYTIDQQVDS